MKMERIYHWEQSWSWDSQGERRDTPMGEELSFQQMVLGLLEMHTKRMNLDPELTLYTKMK